MTREKLQKFLDDFSDNSPTNFLELSEDEPYRDKIGIRLFDRPIFSVTRADDPWFGFIRYPEAVGPHHLMPQDLLPDAKTVISFFLPVDRDTVESNKKDPIEPSIEWLYSRIEGEGFLLALGAAIRDEFIADGYKAIIPILDNRYITQFAGPPAPGTEHVPRFSSNWSERHVAVVTGLGTFGLSTCFISKKGSAGRIISVVTDWDTPPDVRDYDHWLGYCNKCGICQRKCPAQAHYKDKVGKDHDVCRNFIGKTCAKYTPRYGCGKCQTGTPCEYAPVIGS